MAQEIMAEGTPGPGPEGGSLSGSVATLTRPEQKASPVVEGQSPAPHNTPKRPWHIEPEYDPKRADEYRWQVDEKEGSYAVAIDPKTGKEVARVLRQAGGGLFGRGKQPDRNKQNKEEGTGGEAKGGSQGEEGNQDVDSSAAPSESVVSGLTAEDVSLFEKNGTTAEQLNEIIKQHGLENFLAQAEKELEKLRNKARIALTPEQLAEKQAKERAEKIEQLEAERKSLQGESSNTPRERTLLELKRLRINAELEDLGGGGDDGGRGEGLGSKEEEPPSDLNLEYEASPERGRQIAKAIIEQTAKLYAGQLEKVDWPKLSQAYLDQRIHTEAARWVKAKIKVYPAEEQDPAATYQSLKVNREIFRGFKPLAEWLKEYNEGTSVDWDRFNKEVETYFAEADRVGFVKDLKATLAVANKDVRQGIKRNLTSDEIMFGIGGAPGVEHKVQNAVNVMLRAFRIRRGVDPGIDNLAGAGQLYAQRALDRFAAAIIAGDSEGLAQESYLEHDFNLGQQGEGVDVQETFWKATHGWYIEVSAQTPEEFEIAADSYISTLESITSDPKEILDQSQQFIRVLTQSDGAQKLLQTEDGKGFINRLTFRIQARVAVFGANDANERYSPENYKAYMDYENKDGEGPNRYLELVKYLDGLPAGVLEALDNDPRWEILFSLHGPKGELADASPAQRARDGSGLYNQTYDLLVEEMLGVAIRNRKNLSNLTKFTPDETFVSNFDGLFQYGKVPEGRSNGDINIRAYQAALAQTSEGKLTSVQLRDRRVRLGKIQVELNDLRERITKGEEFIKKDGQPYNPSGDEIYDLLENPADAKFYQSELAKVKKAVDIAFQIYGALGEKSKRGGGVFKTDRKVDAQGNEFQYFVPVHMGEKFIQCGATLTKIKYADNSEIWNGYENWTDAISQEIRQKNIKNGQPALKNFKAQYRTRQVEETIKRNIIEFKTNGYEAKLLDADGTVMQIKRPQEDPQTGVVLKDAKGKVSVEKVDADFYTATHHLYANWSGHTYWSYQEEDRHMILSDVTFAKAKAIRDGKLRPQDADMWAEQLLILDPTLKRVRRFTKNFEDRERKLTAAAIEDSYQGHWDITDALYEEFFDKDGTESGLYYGLQDFGGFRKMVEHARARAAEDPERFARRGRRLIPYLRIPISPLSEYLGQGSRGALGVIMMLDAPIYRGAGTFALDKFHAQAELAFKLHEALFITSKDEQGNIVEPLLLKLTNESDTNLQAFFDKMPKEWWLNPAHQQEFCVAVRKSFGRLERYEKLLSTMETMIRNASGAQLLKEVDVLTDNGKLEPEVDKVFEVLPDMNKQDLTRKDLDRFVKQAEQILRLSEDEYNTAFNKGTNDKDPGIDKGASISMNTGSGRHGAKKFHTRFFEMFMDEGERGGLESYPNERFFYKHLKDIIVYYNPDEKDALASTKDDIIAWLFSKFVPT